MEGVLNQGVPPFSVCVDGDNEKVIPVNKLTLAFEEAFPDYLMMGMTYKEYWEMDCTLVKSYRKSFELKKEYDNFKLWLQGMYIYDAVGRISPILHPFAKKGTKPVEYVNEPYPIKVSSTEEDNTSNDTYNSENRKEFEKANDYMEKMMARINASFE